MIQRRGLPRMPATSSTLATSSSSGKVLELLGCPLRQPDVWPASSPRLPPPSASSNRQNDAMNTPSALVATIRALCTTDCRRSKNYVADSRCANYQEPVAHLK